LTNTLLSGILFWLRIISLGLWRLTTGRNPVAKNELLSLALIYSEPRHAYALNGIVKRMNLEQWAHISQASIYNALNRLAESGCVEVTSKKVGRMPERKVFSITNEGRQRLKQELREALLSANTGENPFHLAAMFAFGLSAREFTALLAERIARLERGCEEMTKQRKTLERARAEQALIMLEAGLGHTQVEIDTARKLVELVRKKPQYYEREVTRLLRRIPKSRGADV
jgi:DNA-binding PadR family transcriptional regulator